MHVYLHLHLHLCVRVSECVCACVPARARVCVCVCTHTHIYIYIGATALPPRHARALPRRPTLPRVPSVLKTPRWALPAFYPRLAPPTALGASTLPTGRDQATGCAATASDALGYSSEPPPKVFVLGVSAPRSTLCPPLPAASACCPMLRRSSRARGCGRCRSRLTASRKPR